MNMNNSWPPKIIALIAAIVLWIFVMNEQNPLAEREISLPISIQNIDTDNQIVINSIKSIQVKIRAPRLQLAEIKDNEISAFIDAKGLSAGTHSLPVKFHSPKGIEIVETSNQTVDVVLDDLITRQIPIEVEVEGKVSDDIQIKDLKASPAFLTVIGPASEKNFAEKAKVIVNGADIHGTTTVELVPLLGDRTKLSSHWTISPSKVIVSATVVPKESKYVGIQYQLKGSLPEGLSLGNVRVNPSSATIYGSSAALSKINMLQTVPIDLSSIKETKEITVDLSIPDEITIEHNKVLVSIEVKK